MKKLLTLAALLGVASLSYGQGYVAFFTGTSVIKTNGVTQTGTAGAYSGTFSTGGASWYYELLVAPTTTTTIDGTLAGWTPVFTGTNTATAGRMIGAQFADSSLQVPGYGPTATANFAVVGWSANLGADYAAVVAGKPQTLATTIGAIGSATWATTAAPGVNNVNLIQPDGKAGGWFGISTVGVNIPLAPSGGPYNDVWSGSWVNALNMNYYDVVPEPGTMALVGLGSAAMLIFRRRK